jgi:hypothetical protein
MTTRKHKGRELRPSVAGSGYLTVNFQMRGKKYYIHRLVAEHFIDGDSSLEVNHKDGDKKNNCVSNLEWVTSSENQKHAYKLGFKKAKKGVNHGMVKLLESQVLEIRNDNRTHKNIAVDYNISESLVSKIKQRNLWAHL